MMFSRVREGCIRNKWVMLENIEKVLAVKRPIPKENLYICATTTAIIILLKQLLILFIYNTYLYHSHKKRKDSLETRAVLIEISMLS